MNCATCTAYSKERKGKRDVLELKRHDIEFVYANIVRIH